MSAGISCPSPDRPLGIVFMRLRIAEVNEFAITHIFRDKSIKSGDRLGDAFVVRADHGAQIFGVHAGGERSRTDEVGEHHGNLPAFGRV
jgi:hypothetical protein